MSGLGHHRTNASHSQANKARRELDSLERELHEAIRAGDEASAQKIAQRRAYLLLNSLIP